MNIFGLRSAVYANVTFLKSIIKHSVFTCLLKVFSFSASILSPVYLTDNLDSDSSDKEPPLLICSILIGPFRSAILGKCKDWTPETRRLFIQQSASSEFQLSILERCLYLRKPDTHNVKYHFISPFKLCGETFIDLQYFVAQRKFWTPTLNVVSALMKAHFMISE